MKRLKKIMKWATVALGGLTTLALTANAVFVWTTGSRLEGQLAQIREAGEPLSLAELAREPVPPERNAATFLRRAKTETEAVDRELRALRDTKQFSQWPWSAQTQKTVRSALEAYPKVVPLLIQAVDCPEYDAQLDYTLLPDQFMEELLKEVHSCRGPARVLEARALLLAAQGEHDEALRTALAISRLARHFEHEPMLVGYLPAIAVHGIANHTAGAVLQSGPVSKEVRDALDTEMAKLEGVEGYRWAIQSDRAYGLDFFRTSIPARNFWLLGRGFWDRQESAYLALMDDCLALTVSPAPYNRAGMGSIYIRHFPAKPGGILAEQVFPAIQAVHEAVTRTRAMARCLRVLNAIQTHGPPDGMAIPKLNDLGLPAEAIMDPYTGEPLHVKRLPQGWLVYSVGRNFIDDGGKIDDFSDVGIGPSQ
jgi:hypothetical protein